MTNEREYKMTHDEKIKLENITTNDFDSILDITSTPDVMKNIGNGKIWDDNEVKRFIDYCIKDEDTSDVSRTQYYYKITLENTLIGVIGAHTFIKKELPTKSQDLYLTVYMDQKYQGQGYYSSSLKLLLNQIKKHKPNQSKLYSLVRNSNDKMIQISTNKYKFVKEVILNGESFTLFSIDIKKSRKTVKRTTKSKYLKRGNTMKKTMKTRKHYYLTSTKNISQERIDKLFKKRGNWMNWNKLPQSLRKITNIDFIFIDRIDNDDKKVQSYPSLIKNFIDDNKQKVGRKNELYKNLGNQLKKNLKSSLSNYLLEQYNFDWAIAHKENKISSEIAKVKEIFNKNPTKVWIYKPVAGYHGMNIKIFTTFSEFEDSIKTFIKTYSPIWDEPKNKSKMLLQSNWVLQEYIEKPLLFEGKKCHIRPIFLYSKLEKDNNKYGFILDRILVAHAFENYKFDDFNNPRIHDTHFSSTTSGRIYFQEDFLNKKILSKEQIKKIETQVTDLATHVFDQINSKCYPENKVCYETFGIDLLIDEPSLTIKLLEVQITNMSYGFFKDDKLSGFSNMFEYVFENSLECVIDRVLPPKNKFQKTNGFIKFYQKEF